LLNDFASHGSVNAGAVFTQERQARLASRLAPLLLLGRDASTPRGGGGSSPAKRLAN